MNEFENMNQGFEHNSSMPELVTQLENENWLTSPNVKQAMLAVDRADFIPKELKNSAYIDEVLPIGYEQTISQPKVVAFMLELLSPQPGDELMEVGTGSGWQTGLLAYLVGKQGKISTIEVIEKLYKQAQKNLAKYDFDNINFFCQNAKESLPGLRKGKLFDGIISAAAGKTLPVEWQKQLKIGGRMVVPVGNQIVLCERKSGHKFLIQQYPGFSFVPLV